MSKQCESTPVRSLREIPRFASEDEEREWWATHDLADELWEPATAEDLALLDELKSASTAHSRQTRKFKSAADQQAGREIILDPEQVRMVEQIGLRKKIDFQTLIKQSIAEGIARDSAEKVSNTG